MFRILVFVAFLVFSSSGVESKAQPSRVVGGSPAAPGEFPYQLSIRNDGFGHICGAALLSSKLVLTAGVCADPRSPPIDGIVAGSLYINRDIPTQQVRKPARISTHPDYDGGVTPYNDIALIVLNEPFIFNENISTIRLPPRNRTTYPDPVILSGWGSMQYGLPLSDVLLKVPLDTYSDEYCAAWMERPVPERIICTGADEGGRGGCQGDAGSPLTSTGPEKYLVGVMSHFPCIDACCGNPGPIDHSPEVAFFIDWIYEESRKYGGGL